MGSNTIEHDAPHHHPHEDGLPDDPTLGLGRRDFLRLGGALAAATALGSAGCKMPVEEVVPWTERPEDSNRLGKALFYATVIDETPVLARCRDGRPLLVAPNPGHPSGRGLTVRSQAALLDLYDPDRAASPLSLRRGKGAPVRTSWAAISAALVRHASEARGDTVLLTRPVSGRATRAAIAEVALAGKLRHVRYSPLGDAAAWRCWRRAFGDRPVARPRLDRAALVVGFGAEFIDRPSDGLERDFALGRDPAAPGGMSRFVQFEGRLSLTGANADQRIRVRDSQLATVAAAIAHALIVGKQLGPLAGDAEVAQALGPFAPRSIAASVGLEPTVIDAVVNELVAATGKAIALGGGTPSATGSGLALETAVLLVNLTLGAFESPVFDHTMATTPPHDDGPAGLASLAEAMRSGRVATLIIAGPNPVYDAPPSIGFADAMAKVGLVISLNDRVDETSALADWLAPASHPLESWGDADLGAGVLAVAQPLIRPLHDSYGLLDIVVTWGAALGVGGAVKEAAERSQAKPAPGAATGAPASQAGLGAAYHYLRAYWGAELLGLAPATPAFERQWSEVLRRGYWQGPTPEPSPLAFDPKALELLGVPASSPALELELYPHFALDDGRSANNGWLLELPDPITRLTWSAPVSIAPRRFDEMGLENGDLVELTVGPTKLVAPAYRHAGMHLDQLALPLGLGRPKAGLVGGDVGVNGFLFARLTEGRLERAGLPVEVRRVGKGEPLPFLQGPEVLDRNRRPIVPVATLTEFRANPKAGTEQQATGPSIWPGHRYDGPRWAMAIDLSRCNGCGKCVIACQAENNIPVIGADGVRRGRTMCWIRIDRYYDARPRQGGRGAEVWDGPLDVVEEPVTLFEPMLCQHCENAPCETVCPVAATVHSADGLNQQIYNRCVGTRYCANNCPFKVRRFNWFEYSFARTSTLLRLMFPVLERNAVLNTRGNMALKNNPEVTVRSRGVMEKCSFCVQRIREARAEAIRQGHPGELGDGAVVPACMEACPTGAIVFGNINDPTAKVGALAHGPRAMRLLEATGIEPAISYLTKVRNDNA